MKKNLQLVLNKIFQVVLVLILFFDVYELVNYLSAPEDYMFGSEVNGWRYSSEIHYSGVLLFELLLVSSVLFAGFSRMSINSLLLLRGLAFVIVAVFWFL